MAQFIMISYELAKIWSKNTVAAHVYYSDKPYTFSHILMISAKIILQYFNISIIH